MAINPTALCAGNCCSQGHTEGWGIAQGGGAELGRTDRAYLSTQVRQGSKVRRALEHLVRSCGPLLKYVRRRFAQLQFGPDGGPDLHPSRRLRAQDAPPHPGFGLRAMVLVPRRDVLDPGIDFAC